MTLLKNFKRLLPLLAILIFTVSISAQEFGYNVFGKYKKAITKEELATAKTLKDINSGYPDSWIVSYVSQEVSITQNGSKVIIPGEDINLTKAQKEALLTADLGTEIEIDVRYNSNDFLSNEEKNINFEYTVIPANEAQYPGGSTVMRAYLKQTAIDPLSQELLKKLELAKIDFCVNERGEINNVTVSTSSNNIEIDNLLVKAIRQMPKWIPAQNKDGSNVPQNFEFNVGYMVGC